MMAESQRNSFGALALIGLGVLFLVGQVFGINIWEIAGVSWPVLIMIPGVAFLGLALAGDRKLAGFAIPGMIITGTGGIFWFQNATNYFESWAYVWTLYPVFVGLGLMIMGQRTAKEKEYKTGRGLVTYGLIAFLVAAAFFELMIFGSSTLPGWLLPLGLIGVGGFLLLRGRSTDGKEKRKFASGFDDGALVDAPRKRTNGALTESEKLRQQIDEALAEDEPETPSR